MNRRNKNWGIASIVSAAVTLGLFGGAYAASHSNEHLARVLYWQGYWLQSLIPATNIGSGEHPLYEANPLHILAFFAGLPAGFIFYLFVSLVALRFFTGHEVAQQTVTADRGDERRSG